MSTAIHTMIAWPLSTRYTVVKIVFGLRCTENPMDIWILAPGATGTTYREEEIEFLINLRRDLILD